MISQQTNVNTMVTSLYGFGLECIFMMDMFFLSNFSSNAGFRPDLNMYIQLWTLDYIAVHSCAYTCILHKFLKLDATAAHFCYFGRAAIKGFGPDSIS